MENRKKSYFKQITFFLFFILFFAAVIEGEANVFPLEEQGTVDIGNLGESKTDSDPLIELLYSIPTDVWLSVLGDKGHYHFGQTNPFDPLEDIFDHAVRCLYQFIPDQSAVLDCGCGWGGPAKLLATEKGCKVIGVTTSELQCKFINDHVKEIEVIYKDLHKYIPEERFDCALFLESATHLSNPRQVFSNLSPKVDAIIIRDFIAKGVPIYNSRWGMYFRTKEEMIRILHDSGYEVEYCEEVVSAEDVRKSAQYWLDNLARLNEEEIVGQLASLRNSSLRWRKCSDESRYWSIVVFYAKRMCPTKG
jgi:SAM-dependent methyltransferase